MSGENPYEGGDTSYAISPAAFALDPRPVIEGAALRIRPVMMTVTAVIGGLLPIFWGHGAGATVMRRIAAPMVGGMVSATLLTLLVVPAVYSLWQEALLRRTSPEATPVGPDLDGFVAQGAD